MGNNSKTAEEGLHRIPNTKHFDCKVTWMQPYHKQSFCLWHLENILKLDKFKKKKKSASGTSDRGNNSCVSKLQF